MWNLARLSLAWVAWIVLLLLAIGIRGTISSSAEDPYAALEILRTASQQDIKQAYKRLALKWHPDRNDSPDAGDKFISINQAYEILSDPGRKEQFDRFGTYETPQHHASPHPDFEQFFNFAFGGGQRSDTFDKHRITSRLYAHSLLGKSYTQPFIIYAYSTYCHVCFALEPVWKSAITDLEGLGYGIGTINYMLDGALFSTLRISQIPAMVVLVEGRVVHYRGNMNTLTAKAIRMFARDSIPSSFLTRTTSYSSLKRFLEQWRSTNKPSVLIFGGKEELRLRYLLTAMKFAPFVRFAYISVQQGSPHYNDVEEMKRALSIDCSECEHIFVFKENPESGPAARLATQRGQLFSAEEITSLIEQNKFLSLPRLASQSYLDALCPISSSRAAKHLCVVLPTEGDGAADQDHLDAMREFVDSHQLRSDAVTIAYLDKSRQSDFLQAFHIPVKRSVPTADALDVLVFWRFDRSRAKYTWLYAIWNGTGTIQRQQSFGMLREQIQLIQHGSTRLELTATLAPMVDEYAPSWFTRFSRGTVRMVEAAWYNLSKEESLPILSVIGTFVFIFFIGYGLSQLSGTDDKGERFKEEESLLRKQAATEQKEWVPEDPKVNPEKTAKVRGQTAKQRIWKEMEPMIHELRAETYFGLIRLLKPGCRSIIILVDPETKDVLLPQFSKFIHPLRNNKTFSFGFLNVNKNLSWFRSLLELTLPGDDSSQEPCTSTAPNPGLKDRLKDINPKQTLGTVLVLCGYKLYFSIYHPMHRVAQTVKTNYVGFESGDEASDASDTEAAELKRRQSKGEIPKRTELNPENVLNGFSCFLDRLLEGSVRRYYIPEWPDNLK